MREQVMDVQWTAGDAGVGYPDRLDTRLISMMKGDGSGGINGIIDATGYLPDNSIPPSGPGNNYSLDWKLWLKGPGARRRNQSRPVRLLVI